MFIGLDSNGYFRQGFMKEFNYEIHLDIVPKGDMLYITNATQILPFYELLEIGKDNGIKGLAEYADRLEKFKEKLRKIPEPS